MKNLGLLTVIIPVYNAEKYLKRCLQSVCDQTYPFLDIILIDDGSTDNSGPICDNYSDMDKRVRVFHVKNGGQASARNIGLSNVKGDYITFIDNDDWIEPKMYEKLMVLMNKYECPIVGCATLKEFEDSSTFNEYKDRKSGIVSGKKCNLDILYQDRHAWGALWNKIYKKELWNNISFPDGKQLEDYLVITKLFATADRVLFCNEPMHHYTIRNDSQSKKSFTEEKLTIIESAEKIRDYFVRYSSDKDIIRASNYFVFFNLVNVMWDCYKSEYDNKKEIICKYKNKAIKTLKKCICVPKRRRKMINLTVKLMYMIVYAKGDKK